MSNINDTIIQLKTLARQCREQDPQKAPDSTVVEVITQRAVADLEVMFATLALREKELAGLRLEVKTLREDNEMKKNQITILSEKVD